MSLPTEEATLRRLLEAWRNPDVTNKDLRRRFSLGDDSILELRTRWGLRPQPARLTPRTGLRRALDRFRTA